MTSRRHVQPGWAACSRCPFAAAGAASVWVTDGPAGLPASGGRALGTLQGHDPLTKGLPLPDFLRNLLIRRRQRAL